jgi:hypothetical protein
MRWIWIALLLACGGKSDAPAPDERPAMRLITDAEIAKYTADLMRKLGDNAKRKCERPVLRGSPATGSGAADLAVFDRPEGSLAKCLTELAAIKPEDFAAKPPAVVELDGRCGGEVEGAIRKATQHADMCSPFQIGQREPLSAVPPYIGVARLVAVRARLLAERKNVDGALWLLLDTIRMNHDLARGHVSMLTAVIASASNDIVLDAAQAILAGSPPPAKLDELGEAVDRLLATAPSIADPIAGEAEHMSLFVGLAPLQPADWTPPGGWAEGKRPTPNPQQKSFGDVRDDKAIMLVVADSLATTLAGACPAGATYKHCHAKLTKVVREGLARAAGNTNVAQVYKTLSKQHASAPDAEAARLQIRGAIIEILTGMATAAFNIYVEKPAAGYARLVALRLHLEVVRAKRCPTAAQLTAAPYAALRAPALLGDSVAIAAGSNAIEIRPPSWIKDTRREWAIPCL